MHMLEPRAYTLVVHELWPLWDVWQTMMYVCRINIWIFGEISILYIYAPSFDKYMCGITKDSWKVERHICERNCIIIMFFFCTYNYVRVCVRILHMMHKFVKIYYFFFFKFIIQTFVTKLGFCADFFFVVDKILE